MTDTVADGPASRRRLLSAATEEFAAFGIAGARVDRIVATAQINKAQLYAWYGSKDGLFDVVFAAHVEQVVDAVPLTADDLPGYATRLYDVYLERPEMVRLSTWARLERTPSGHLFAEAAETGKLAAIAAAQQDGYLRPDLEPVDIHSLVISMSMTWSPASTLIAADKTEDPALHARRKQALATSVAAAFCTRAPKR
jgi:AcrR family transcriptional regulator